MRQVKAYPRAQHLAFSNGLQMSFIKQSFIESCLLLSSPVVFVPLHLGSTTQPPSEV